MNLFGIRFVGITAENGHKLLLTILFVGAIWALRRLAHFIIFRLTTESSQRSVRARFWSHQFVGLLTFVILVLTLLSIWFDDPTRLTTGLGLFSAGLAFALQKVVTSFAGYFVIIRGENFSVGDRITMGGIRGDVIKLGLLQTTIMEMGQPPSVQTDAPAMWIRGRQYTGRIVTVTNDKIFEEPVYNYSREFPFIWEELKIPVKYGSDYKRAEQMILEVVTRHTKDLVESSQSHREQLEKKYGIITSDVLPKVFYRLTDNWIELSARYIVHEHGVRDVKDAISRELLDLFERGGLEIASSTFEVVGVPPLRVQTESFSAKPSPQLHQ